jgi:hypothetical protein
MVGGTFGVAVMGALIATLGRSKIDSALPRLPESVRAKLTSSLGAGGFSGHHGPPAIVSAVERAFVSSLGTGLEIGAGVTLCAAVLAWVLVESKAKLAQPVAPGAAATVPIAEPNASGEAAASEAAA